MPRGIWQKYCFISPCRLRVLPEHACGCKDLEQLLARKWEKMTNVRLFNVSVGLMVLALSLGCGKPQPIEKVFPGPSAPASGTTPSPATTPAVVPPPTPSGPTICTGIYFYQSGDQFQRVALRSDGRCEISDNSGVVESFAECSHSQQGTQLTLSSGGVSVYWRLGSACDFITPNNTVLYFIEP